MRRLLVGVIGGVLAVMLSAVPVLACGGLVAPNGSVNLVRTTTLAAYADGIEHYVTSFEFSGGGGGKFGSIVPLPDVPTDVRKGGRWTLQRLVQEVQPPVAFAADEDGRRSSFNQEAEVLLETRVSALDITVLKGGGDAVGNWAGDNGFSLPPDAPEVLDFYAERSPIFMAVRFNLKRAQAKELQVGDGIPVHITIPTDQPWVPLRILGLGRNANEVIEADVFLLTEDKPALLPQADTLPEEQGLILERSEPASELLLADLRSDRGMEWLPASGMWLDYIRINTPAGLLDHDLAINVSGGSPSRVDAGFNVPSPRLPLPSSGAAVVWWPWAAAVVFGAAFIAATNRLGSTRP
jgi:hypothetical protein